MNTKASQMATTALDMRSTVSSLCKRLPALDAELRPSIEQEVLCRAVAALLECGYSCI